MNLTRGAYTRLFARIMLIGYLGFCIFGFLHILHMAEMPMHMDDCPFSLTLVGVDHKNLGTFFQGIQTTIFYAILYYSIPALLLPFFLTTKTPFQSLILLHEYGKGQKRRKRYREPLYTSLFERGILHPKLF